MAIQERVSTRHHTVTGRRLERLRCGLQPRTLDLFSGCGGLSLGFDAAGFSVVGGVEIDALAARSHALNFHGAASPGILAAQAAPRDMTELDADDLLAQLCGEDEAPKTIDVLVGGPPCQAFARVGRAKLREVAAHPDAFRQDRRANLYLRYLDYVRQLHPIALVMENVPDVLNFGGHNIPQEMCEALEELGYVCRYTLLNAAFYGVPEMRERLFLLAIDASCGVEPRFPDPTHWISLPRGYAGTRAVALKHVSLPIFGNRNFVSPPVPSPDLPQAITAREAIADLPRITAHLEGLMPRGTRRFDTILPYPTDVASSPYARLMREWPGFESHVGVADHVIRSLPRDYAIFSRMNPGDQYPEAYEHAHTLFEERRASLIAQGQDVAPDSPEFVRLWEATVPPYDLGKFPNRWRKMEDDRPARTLTAHLGKDSYSHIHYDSAQARTISVREAARLQSFPDGFIFQGSMNPAFRQIGNAVPPLLANAVAHALLGALEIPAARPPLVERMSGR